MEKDGFELSAEHAAETDHCDNTSQIPTETTSPPLEALPGGYDVSRFNALRHGVLSAHTVLPWEDKAQYEALLSALVQEHAPHGPTEEHLVEELSGVIWRKRRLRLAEATSYREGLRGGQNTLRSALINVESIIDDLTKIRLQPADWDRRQTSVRKAVEILSERTSGAYDAALAELDGSTRKSWEEEIAPEPEDLEEDENSDSDVSPFTADATGLKEFLVFRVLRQLVEQAEYIENRQLIREQVLGEAFPSTRLEQLSRYEVHLDRKFERMLAMLLRLKSLPRSNEVS
ncbi:MAG: hypothetical protein WAM39_05350 [Bryobacteraceae bacterium]